MPSHPLSGQAAPITVGVSGGLENTQTTAGKSDKELVQINIYMRDAPAGPAAGPGSTPGSGPGTGPGSGTRPGAGAGSGPGAGPGSGPGTSGPGSGPGAGPGSGSGTTGSSSGPGAGPGSGPGTTGPGSGPGAGPGSGPGTTGSSSGPGAGPGSGPGTTGSSSGPGAGPGSGPGTTGSSSGPGAGPGSGPGTTVSSSGPGAGPGSGPGTTVSSSGPGAGPGSGPGVTTNSGDAFADQAASTFLGLINQATSGDAQEAQNIILRRIALEGDVVPSRVPAPLNITEIGGYLNLLTNLKETAMRSQVLAGILGVAGPVDAAGWIPTKPPQIFRMVLNDRPAGAAQASIPVTVPIRSDFAYGLLQAIKALHAQGCMLPLLGAPIMLPTSVLDPTTPVDPMPYLGRVLTLAAATALAQPSSDALVLARNTGTTDLFQVAANSLNVASAAVTPGNYDALQGSATGISTISITGASLVYVNPLLAAAGFYPASPLPQPASIFDTTWAVYKNVTSLTPGQTRLGDELGQLYAWTDIAGSVFSSMTSYVWNGSTFASS